MGIYTQDTRYRTALGYGVEYNEYRELIWLFVYYVAGMEEVESVVCRALRLEIILRMTELVCLLARREARMIPGYIYCFDNYRYP